jgi:hypothetical protein
MSLLPQDNSDLMKDHIKAILELGFVVWGQWDVVGNCWTQPSFVAIACALKELTCVSLLTLGFVAASGPRTTASKA